MIKKLLLALVLLPLSTATIAQEMTEERARGLLNNRSPANYIDASSYIVYNPNDGVYAVCFRNINTGEGACQTVETLIIQIQEIQRAKALIDSLDPAGDSI